jgi:hypothetical protein
MHCESASAELLAPADPSGFEVEPPQATSATAEPMASATYRARDFMSVVIRTIK